MTGPGRRFDPAELLGGSDGDPTEAEVADAFAAARSLEAIAWSDQVHPTDGFEDRVMAAIAAEPAPRVVVRRSGVAQAGLLAGLVVAIQDAWGIATTGHGRPLAVRAQALGLLLLVGVVVTSLGGVAAVGVGALLTPDETPSPSIQVPPPSTPTPTPALIQSPSASPKPTASPTQTTEPTQTSEPTETNESGATETPEATDDHGGDSSTERPGATETADPDDTPDPGETLTPGETLKPDSSDDGGGSRSSG